MNWREKTEVDFESLGNLSITVRKYQSFNMWTPPNHYGGNRFRRKQQKKIHSASYVGCFASYCSLKFALRFEGSSECVNFKGNRSCLKFTTSSAYSGDKLISLNIRDANLQTQASVSSSDSLCIDLTRLDSVSFARSDISFHFHFREIVFIISTLCLSSSLVFSLLTFSRELKVKLIALNVPEKSTSEPVTAQWEGVEWKNRWCKFFVFFQQVFAKRWSYGKARDFSIVRCYAKSRE